ncbi:MAG: 1-deoxy-D-xylulose-5-phosphate synthase [Candidatus Omnitrophota bacterium]|nr:MAG: 1-deoxy-D-xylulose-5-phosphate synthase [Candidatus Omnitrophota bacterium]
MSSHILERINGPDDVRQLEKTELDALAKELRHAIIDTVSEKGGHLAPSLGAVELTIALHRVYESPKDKIIWDVGHQTYGHKLLTGRMDRFHTLRQYKGISGFPRRWENPHDHYGTGHASTSVSAAVGMAVARDLKGEDYKVVAIIGDGGLTGGIAYEGLDHAGELKKDLLVILNDNDMSISPNVGGISHYLNRILSSYYYNKTKEGVENFLEKQMGNTLMRRLQKVEESIKSLIVPGVFFEELGFRYFGPIDGHDVHLLEDTLRSLRDLKGPLLLHIITEKGHGYEPAENDPANWHGAKPFDKITGEPIVKKITKPSPPAYTQVFGKVMCKMAGKNPRVVGITAAMASGTGLSGLQKKFPNQFFDVGIAEQHAVTLAAGLACEGIRPVVAIYSTFLQRAYDQIYHETCIQNLPVIFAIDRGGVVGDDGATHQGLYDIAYLRAFPNIVVSAAADEKELSQLLWTGLQHSGPFAVRYPRSNGEGVAWSDEEEPLPIGKGTVLQEGSEIAILAYGYMVYRALEAAELLRKNGIRPTVVNMRFAKPLDVELIQELIPNHTHFVTYEDHTISGGFGSAVSEALHDLGLETIPLLRLAVPDEIIEQGLRDEVFEEHNLLPKQAAGRILQFINAKVHAAAV